ncbi:MAG: IucA/IucC family siderophore biosynthesis protein [Ectobacillus sp.]
MSVNTIPPYEIDILSKAFDYLQEGGILQDEANILAFLRKHNSDLIPAYVQSLVKGRQGILRKLAGSMLREDIMGLASRSYDLYAIESIYTINVPAIDDYWQTILQALQAYGIKGGKIYKLYPLLGKECLVIPVTRTYAFNRVEAEGLMLHIKEGGVKTIEHAVELLQLLRKKEEALDKKNVSDWIKLAEELMNGSANLALSYAYWERKKKELQHKAYKQGITNSIDWVLLKKKQNPEFDSSLFFEQLSIEGHNLHPGAKTKIGMEPRDVFRYAPEFDGIVDIRFAGIRKDYAEWSMIEENEEDINAFLFKEYPELQLAAEQELKKQGLCPNDYVLVPVHSWQLENAVREIYCEEIKKKIVVPIHGIKVPCGATSSFRTVVPYHSKTPKYAIKVAVNSQMTSTVRSISANTTNNAPVFTRLIRSIMQKEEKLLQTFVPVCECAGVNFKTKETNQNELKNRNLSAVFRENIEAFVAQDEVAIVGSSLFAESPFTGKIILQELVERFAKERKEPSLRKAAFQFVIDYASIALPGFLTLLVKYGIGLEGHLQNSVMVFKGGGPVRMLFRDWGGVRIYQDRLRQHQLQSQFYPNSVTVTNHLKEVHNKVIYTVLQNHFGEFILQISKNYGLGEGELWKEIYRICERVFGELEALPQYRENARIDKEAFYQEKVDYKALTKMRLKSNGKNYSYSVVQNPLYEFSRVKGK